MYNSQIRRMLLAAVIPAWIACIACACWIILFPAVFSAASSEQEGQNAANILSRTTQAGYTIEIRDEQGLLTAEEAESLLDELEQTGRYTNAAFASYDDKRTTQDWVDDNYYDTGFFKPGGIVFVIDMYHRNLNLRFEGNVKKKLGYSTATSIEDNVYRYATDGDYYACAQKVFSQVGMIYAGQRIAQPMKAVISLLLGLCAAMMFLFLFVRRSRIQKRQTGSLLAGSIGAAALGAAVTTAVTKRRKITSDSSGGGSSGGGGGGGFSGGGFSGGGGSSGGAGHGF